MKLKSIIIISLLLLVVPMLMGQDSGAWRPTPGYNTSGMNPSASDCSPGINCPTGNCPTTTTPYQPTKIVASTAPKSACKVIAYRGREEAPGSGVLIRRGDDFGLVLSCAHGPQDATRHEVIFPSTGERFTATEVAVNRRRDTAILKTVGRPSVSPAKMGQVFPQPGEKIYSGGFGMPERGERWATHPGYYIGQEDSKTNRGLFGRLMSWRGRMRMGDSGGPVWNRHGEVIGINTGTNEREGISIGPGPDAVVEILSAYDDACAPAGDEPPVNVDVVVTPSVPAPPVPIPDTELQAKIADLQNQIDELKASGVQGPKGDRGEQGLPGTAPDVSTVVDAAVYQLKADYSLKVRFLDGKGQEAQAVIIGWGEPLNIPPSRISIIGGNEVTETSAVLGEPLRLRSSIVDN